MCALARSHPVVVKTAANTQYDLQPLRCFEQFLFMYLYGSCVLYGSKVRTFLLGFAFFFVVWCVCVYVCVMPFVCMQILFAFSIVFNSFCLLNSINTWLLTLQTPKTASFVGFCYTNIAAILFCN